MLEFLTANEALSEELCAKRLRWRYCGGFSAHNQVRVAREDREGRIKLAGYMIRAPMSLEKMTYDAATGTVIYRSKMHAGLKRNFQVMPGAQWLELLCKHIPDRHEHLVRYVGWYSNRARRTREGAQGATTREDAPGSRGSGKRVRHPRQGHLGAADSQGLRS